MHQTRPKPQISISYFYINACGSCDEESKFRLKYDSLIGNLDAGVDVDLMMYNTFHASEAALMSEYISVCKVPDEKRLLPILFINGSYLAGADEIDSRLKSEFVKYLQIKDPTGSLTYLTTDGNSSNGGNAEYKVTKNCTTNSILIYFYVPSCDDCLEVADNLKILKDRYTIITEGREIVSDVVIKMYNIGEAANMQLIADYFHYYRVPEKDQKVPIIFIGGKWYSGAEADESALEGAVFKGDGLGTYELMANNSTPDIQANLLPDYTILGVIATGLINGFNPCSISIVLFLLSLLAAKNINLLKAGLAFIAGKFIMFFLLGTLLYQLFIKVNINWLQTVTKIILIAMALVFVFLNLHDMISAKREKYSKIRLQLPETLRRLNHRMIKTIARMDSEGVFLPMCFLMGMLIAAGEFLCTGQIYLATIVLILQNGTAINTRAVFYFLIYGIAFVSPLLFLTGLIHKGKEVFEVSEAVRAKIPLVKMVNAFVFLAFAVWALFLF